VLLIRERARQRQLAALWTFRDDAAKLIAPLIGTLVLGWALIRNGGDTIADDYGLTTLLGLGGVFVIGVATLLIGVVAMVLWNLRAPAFFRGETL